MFVENDILRIQEADGKNRLERILWVDEGSIICYTINIQSRAYPIKRKISDLQQLYNEGLLSFENSEPFSFIYQSEEQLSEKNKKIREARWEYIEPLILKEPDIYDSHLRGKLIQQLMSETKKNKVSTYKYLIQYWQRGKVKNSLLPDYSRSGGKGKKKNLSDQKNGRPRKFAATIGEGIVITEEIKQIFEVSIKRWYHTTKKNSLSFVYNEMKRTYFVTDWRCENGVEKPILMDENQIPTMRQFQYWYSQTYGSEEKLRKRKGNRKYELENRAVLGTSVGKLDGPGSRFQIDATVADVYLVSSFNRNWIIGRPIIYVVIDVFSRMVVGLYVGLEGPSWFGAMMAIANTASDKVSYCQQYGIEISKEEWNTHYLPQTILADRGELEGFNVERLIKAFNIKVENTPPYRGDWKGIVEQHFRLIHTKVKPFVPGSVDMDVRVRGDRDYRLDATLTIEEFTKIIIKCMLQHNNSHWLKDYPVDEMLIRDEVPLIPCELWNWGIQHRSGKLRFYPANIVKLHLLPTANASVTFKGIEFKGMRYSSETALKEGWFGEARNRSWKIPICYDPRNMGQIYLPNEEGIDYEVAYLLEHYQHYNGKTLEETQYALDHSKLKIQTHSPKESQTIADLSSDIEHITKQAQRATKKEKVEMSNNQRTKGIRDNRGIEKEARRKEEAFLLESMDVIKADTPLEKEETSFIRKEPSTKIALLRQKQKEKLERVKNKN